MKLLFTAIAALRPEQRKKRQRVSRSRVSGVAGVIASLVLVSPMVGATPVNNALDRPATLSRLGPHSLMLGADHAGKRIVAVGERGLILLSDDEGAHWRQSEAPVAVTLTAVRFADAHNGYVIGHGGTVLKTTDGGEHWTRQLDGRRIAQIMLAEAKATGDKTALRSAERLVSDGPDKPLLDLLVQSPDKVEVVGAYGLALKTEDGGQTWTSWQSRLENPLALHLYALRQEGQRVLVAGEQGLVCLSVDNGKTFEALETPYEGSFFTAELLGDKGILLAGLRGNVWRSNDDGKNWTQLQSPVSANITASLKRTGNQVLMVNQAGMVLGERNEHLTPLTHHPLPPLNYLLTTANGGLLALSVHGLFEIASGDLK